MAKGKSKDLKPKTAVSTKSTTEAGKGKRIPTQPPGMPRASITFPLRRWATVVVDPAQRS